MQVESRPQKPPNPGGETAMHTRHFNAVRCMHNDGCVQKWSTDMQYIWPGGRDDMVVKKGFEEKS